MPGIGSDCLAKGVGLPCIPTNGGVYGRRGGRPQGPPGEATGGNGPPARLVSSIPPWQSLSRSIGSFPQGTGRPDAGRDVPFRTACLVPEVVEGDHFAVGTLHAARVAEIASDAVVVQPVRCTPGLDCVAAAASSAA